MGIVVMWLPLNASSRPLSGLHCTDVVLWSLTVSRALVVSQFGDAVTIIAGAYRTIRKLVSSDARRLRWSAAAWRYPPVLPGRPPALPRYPPTSPGCAPGGVGCFRVLRGRWRWGGVGGLDVNGMCLAACLADWGKQKKQFRRTASYGWQMGLEPTTFRTTI